jgi:hypothetical protein
LDKAGKRPALKIFEKTWGARLLMAAKKAPLFFAAFAALFYRLPKTDRLKKLDKASATKQSLKLVLRLFFERALV